MGRVRTDNEDRALARPPVFAVADGMGGHQAGDVAAELAIGHLADAVSLGRRPDGRLLVDAIESANEAIRLESRTRPELLGMGTTCTVVLVTDVVTIAHVGDSRAYRLRAGRLERLTEDHSLVAAMVRDGRLDPAEAATDPRRHVITRALGADEDVRVDLVTVDRLPGDRLLLCSDGIHGQVDDAAIRRVLAELTEPGAAADRLIALAGAAGGADNATAIVIDADEIAAIGADVPAVDIKPLRRSRRSAASRGAIVAIAAAIIVVAAAAWLASGGAGPAGPSPSVVAPSVKLPSPSIAPPSSPGPSVASPSVTPSAPSPSVAGPSAAASPS